MLSGFLARLVGFWEKHRQLGFGLTTGWVTLLLIVLVFHILLGKFLGFTVSDYYFDGVWHLDEFFVMKHLEIVEDIMNYSCDAESDFLVWSHSVHDSLSTKVAYSGLQQRYPMVTWGKWIWGSFIPAKRSTAIWRLIHGKLPTWDYIHFRGFSGLSKCLFCYSAGEDLDNLFCHCPWTHHIISQVFSIFNVHLSFEFGFGYWLLQACRRDFSPQVAALWRLCVVTIIWVIWDHRNKRIFEERVLRDTSILAGFWVLVREAGASISAPIRNSLTDLAIISACGVKGRPPRASTIKCCCWQLPTAGVLKINIDGSVVGSPGLLTGGGVFRDHFGVFRGCFAVMHGRNFAFETELATELIAIELAHEKGWFNI
ncbi:hypothetical protein ACS0TY_026525 [Phlomoides rotata]